MPKLFGFRQLRLGAFALLALLSVAWGGAQALRNSADLLRRAEEVQLFLERTDPYLDPDCTYPPSAIPVFAAIIAPLRADAVRTVWLGLNLVTLCVVCVAFLRLWGREWSGTLRAMVVLTLISSKPVRLGIGLGQFHLMPLVLILLSILAMRAGRRLVGGLLVGLALTKPTMALPFLAFLAARKQWTMLVAATGFQGIALIGSSAWLRIWPHTLIAEWLKLARLQQGAGLIDVPTILHRIMPQAASHGTALGVIVLCAACAVIYRYRACSDLALVSVASLAAAISTYHRPYDLVLLFPPFFYLINVARDRDVYRTRSNFGVAVLFGMLLIVPVEPFARIGLEHAYDAVFATAAYALLVGTVVAMMREPSAPRVQGVLTHAVSRLKPERIRGARHGQNAVGDVLVHGKAEFLGPLRDIFA